MCPSKLKSVLAGLLAVASVSWLYADGVVDAGFDDNQNDLEWYWYYYDDNAGVGPNDRPQIAPTLKPSVINVTYTEKARAAFGDAADTWKVKTYAFKVGESMSKKCAIMPFTFGEPWKASYCTGKACAMPYVGLGTMLAKEGGSLDLTGVTAVKFYIKSRVQDLADVRFKIETLDINTYSNKKGSEMQGDEFGYYGKTIAVTKGDWTLVTVPVADLALPGTWAHDFDFDLKKATKLAWEITGDGTITGDTLDVADVQFVGTWTWTSPSYWMKTETAAPAAGAFASFDKMPYNQAPKLLTYWYAYNDAEIKGTSSVTATYAVKDETTGKLSMNFVAGTGSDGVGRGAALEYTLGAPIPKNDTVSILGFVGIGINLYDSAKTKYWDAAAAGANSVYFEYLSDGAKCVTFELSDINDVGDATNPTRVDSRGSGIVYYRNFPDTKGAWKKVMIPFDSLVVHDTWVGYKAIPLDKTKLAKAQWKIQGAQGSQGLYAIDNVYFPAADFGYSISIGVKSGKNAISAKSSSFNAAYVNGVVRATWSGARIVGGKINLINARGAVVASSPVNRGMMVSAAIPAANVPAGKYVVSLNAVDGSGKAVVSQASVSIVK